MSSLSWHGSRCAQVRTHARGIACDLLVGVRITVMQTLFTVKPGQLTCQRRLSGTSSNVLCCLRQQQRHCIETCKHAPRHVVTCDVTPILPSQVVIKKVTSALRCRNDPSGQLRERTPLAPAAADAIRQRSSRERVTGARAADLSADTIDKQTVHIQTDGNVDHVRCVAETIHQRSSESVLRWRLQQQTGRDVSVVPEALVQARTAALGQMKKLAAEGRVNDIAQLYAQVRLRIAFCALQTND